MIKGRNHKHQLSMLTRTKTSREVDYLRCVICKVQWEIKHFNDRSGTGTVTLGAPESL